MSIHEATWKPADSTSTQLDLLTINVRKRAYINFMFLLSGVALAMILPIEFILAEHPELANRTVILIVYIIYLFSFVSKNVIFTVRPHH